MFTLFSLALLATIPGPATSPLVEESHQHDWFVILEGDEPFAWIDRNWRDTYRADDIEYPVVLVRVRSDGPGGSFLGDSQLAVDCAHDRIGIRAGWGISELRGESERRVENVRFNFQGNPPDALDRSIMDFACER